MPVSKTGNAVTVDDTTLLQAATSDYSLANSVLPGDEEQAILQDTLCIIDDSDHSYCNRRLDPLIENVLVYISGMAS